MVGTLIVRCYFDEYASNALGKCEIWSTTGFADTEISSFRLTSAEDTDDFGPVCGKENQPRMRPAGYTNEISAAVFDLALLARSAGSAIPRILAIGRHEAHRP